MRFLLFALVLFSSICSAQSLSDPTRPATQQNSETADVVVNQGAVLSAIMMMAERKVAIINGISMTEGSEQHGIKVLKINADHVIVEQLLDGLVQTRTLRVNSTGEIKKNATDNF